MSDSPACLQLQIAPQTVTYNRSNSFDRTIKTTSVSPPSQTAIRWRKLAWRMSDRVKVALVGIAGFGESYVRTFLNDPQAAKIEFVGGADPAPQRCRQLPEMQARGVPIFPNFAALLQSTQPEMAILCTPIHLHAEQTVQAISRGIPVLCEKPLAGGLDDALTIVRAQQQSKLMVAIGYQWSFSTAVQSLKADILNGTLGAPKQLKTLVSYPRPLVYFQRNSWAGRINTPDGRPVLDSPVNNATAHFLHNMLYLLGDAWNTSAAPRKLQAELYRANAIENYDNAALRCIMPDGAEVLFYAAHSMPEKVGPNCQFEFENATVTSDSTTSYDFVARFRDGTTKSYGNPDAYRADKIWHCANAVRSGGEVACPAHAALPHTLCVLAAQRSMPAVTLFPNSALREATIDGEPMIAIDGLIESFSAAYEKSGLPSELGTVAWARAGDWVELEPPTV
jgi:predicted dehydrogenase